jgi:hypothetical protein
VPQKKSAATTSSASEPGLFPTAGELNSIFFLAHSVGVSTRPVSNRLATALRLAAQSLNRVKSALGDWFRRMRAKLGPAGAFTATAPQIGAYPLHDDHDPHRFRPLPTG